MVYGQTFSRSCLQHLEQILGYLLCCRTEAVLFKIYHPEQSIFWGNLIKVYQVYRRFHEILHNCLDRTSFHIQSFCNDTMSFS